MCLARGTMVHLLRVCSFHMPYDHLMKNIGIFLHSNFTLIVFLSLYCIFKIAMAHSHICRSTSTPDLINNNSAIAIYDFEHPIYQAKDEGEEDCEIPGELARLLMQEEKSIQPHEEPIEVINLGTKANKKEVKIGANLEESVKGSLVQMLHDYIEVFACSYEDMSGLDTDIVVHHLPMKEDCPPVKQKVRCMRPDMSEKIKNEVMKQFDAGFLEMTSYP